MPIVWGLLLLPALHRCHFEVWGSHNEITENSFGAGDRQTVRVPGVLQGASIFVKVSL